MAEVEARTARVDGVEAGICAVLFLVSEGGRYITDRRISVNGGGF